MSGILHGSCCQIFRNIPQKTHMNGFTKQNSFYKRDTFSERLQQRLINKRNI